MLFRIGSFICCIIAVLACGHDSSRAAAQRDCAASDTSVLTDSGVGALRIGARVEQLYVLCQVLDDVTYEQGTEGQPERRITVVLGSIATAATVVDGRVWRIELDTRRFRTRDSLGVGSTVSELRSQGARVISGEGNTFVVRPDHCGMSFRLEGIRPGEAKAIEQLPDSMPVDLVLIFGCR